MSEVQLFSVVTLPNTLEVKDQKQCFFTEKYYKQMLTPRKLTCPLKRDHVKRKGFSSKHHFQGRSQRKGVKLGVPKIPS